ncbi:uncharacterized, partial [Tachysurus ichikawai]
MGSSMTTDPYPSSHHVLTKRKPETGRSVSVTSLTSALHLIQNVLRFSPGIRGNKNPTNVRNGQKDVREKLHLQKLHFPTRKKKKRRICLELSELSVRYVSTLPLS